MYGKTFSAAVHGIEGQIVNVEADVCDGLPLFSMVGYLGSEVKEARERVKIALKNFGYRLPPKHITINLSPADMRKEGTAFDLAIAIAILEALGYIAESECENTLLMGELSLHGEIGGVNGILPVVYRAKQEGFKRCIVPLSNVKEGAMVEGIAVYGARTLLETVEALEGKRKLIAEKCGRSARLTEKKKDRAPDFSEICGQDGLKRAVEVAVSGMHHLLMIGPPGVGKTMIARRIAGIMPDLSFEESMEISKVLSTCGLLKEEAAVMERPFRAPHHTITKSALIGGGFYPKAGEISFATKGVLFLDELTEFSKATLELLRQPLEDKKITITRMNGTYEYPADFMLVGAMNPCQCGYYPDRNRCRCTLPEIKRYLNKLSGPLLSRIDICAEAVPIDYKRLSAERKEEASETIRKRVMAARDIQNTRYQNEAISFNSGLTPSLIKKYCKLSGEGKDLLSSAFETEPLSARGYHKIIKTARTIADLDGGGDILPKHLAESIFYRAGDRKYRA